MDRLPRRRRIYDQFTEDDSAYAGNYPLSKQILDYYYKFGQERNLERYLKLNRSLGSKSSSDGSLDQHSGRPRSVHFAPQPSRERSKSADYLERPNREEKLLPTESTSYQSCLGSAEGGILESSSSSEMIVASGIQTDQQRRVNVRRDGRKSYQINVESKVEIAFPTQFYQAMTAGIGLPAQNEVAASKHPVSVTAVNSQQAKNVESKDVVEVPIEVSLNQTIKNQSTISEFQPVSPASSIASNKQRLEWDSLGDVGYQRSQSVDCVPLKKSVLKLQSKSASEPPTMTSSKSTGAIPKRKMLPPPPPPEKVTPTKGADSGSAKGPEKWRQLLKRVKDKSSVISESSAHLETPSSKILFDANSSKFAQSTPVVSPSLGEDEEDTPQKTRREEKSSQTNDVGTVSRSIQAIYENLDKTTSMSTVHESTAGSFEFIRGSHVDRGCSAISSSSMASTSVDETERRTNTLRIRKEISRFLGNVTGKDPDRAVDLQKAVDYIALLFDSRSIDRKFKRKLVEKIISKLLRSKGKDEKEVSQNQKRDSSAHDNKSISVAADSCSSKCDSSKDSTKLSDIKQSELLKDWLKPMTNSEIEYEKRKEEEEKSRSIEEKPETPGQRSPENSLSASISLSNHEKQKNLQLKCIEREIEYLERIKKLIQVGRMNLMDDTNQNVMALQQRTIRASESRTTAEESLSMASSRNSVSVASSRGTNESDWDSHKNLQIVIKDRRKLNTPPDNQPPVRHHEAGNFEQLKDFVDRRTKEFAERYEKRTSIYTNPSKHYSEPRSSSVVDDMRPPRMMVNASTSVNSCEFSCTGPEFIKTSSTMESSAASRLAAVTSNNKPTTVRRSETAQTGTSLSFSAPITSSRNRPRSGRSNQRNGVLQTAVKSCPESIAYTIVLNPKAMVPASSVHTETTTTSTTNGSALDLLYDKVGGQGTDTARMKICESGRFRLEDFLKLNRPDFIEQAGERKDEVETARRRRAQKNQEKENLLMSPHLPRGKISKLLEQSLKDPQISRTSSNASGIYKQQARRKYQKLPEVIKKDDAEKQNAYKRNTKILAEVFTKNLQQIVLRGETNIPHSRRVLTTL